MAGCHLTIFDYTTSLYYYSNINWIHTHAYGFSFAFNLEYTKCVIFLKNLHAVRQQLLLVILLTTINTYAKEILTVLVLII